MRALLIVLAVPAMASAQTTNTNCMVNGQWLNCTTQGPISGVDTRPTDFLGAMGGAQNTPDPYREQQQALRNQQAAQLRQLYIEAQQRQASAPANAPPPEFVEGWSQLADLIKEHRCGEAIDLAIRRGGTEAGLRTKALCQ
jgi:hypothetical protein